MKYNEQEVLFASGILTLEEIRQKIAEAKNQTDSGQSALPPSEDRWKIRSETFSGIAQAMADQWGPVIEEELKQAREVHYV